WLAGAEIRAGTGVQLLSRGAGAGVVGWLRSAWGAAAGARAHGGGRLDVFDRRAREGVAGGARGIERDRERADGGVPALGGRVCRGGEGEVARAAAAGSRRVVRPGAAAAGRDRRGRAAARLPAEL